ncbi:MAG: hypothetical protein KGN84_07455 [Acidobacteriota bacterium]|nr:hypothetical protein [Acidobacteriota bacterium]
MKIDAVMESLLTRLRSLERAIEEFEDLAESELASRRFERHAATGPADRESSAETLRRLSDLLDSGKPKARVGSAE